jgi:hypothetical protein
MGVDVVAPDIAELIKRLEADVRSNDGDYYLGGTVQIMREAIDALTRLSAAQGDPWVTVDIVDQFTRFSPAPEVNPGALWFPATPETDR